MNLQEKAKIFAQEISASEECKEFKKMLEEVQKDENTFNALMELKTKQAEIQKASVVGQVSEEMLKETQELYYESIVNPTLAKYFQAEYKFTEVMQDIQKIIAETIDQ